MWENVNQTLERKKKSRLDEVIKAAMGKTRNTEEIVNGFADCFEQGVEEIKHICRMTQNITKNTDNEFDEGQELQSMFYILRATNTELKKIIFGMNINKSPGKDNIRIKDIQFITNDFVDTLTTLINKSIKEGCFPDCLKTSIIRPIYSNQKNYRPITFLPAIQRIMEKYVLSFLNKYLLENQIINSQQYDFQKGKSTQDALEDFTNKANSLLNSRCHALCLFIDLSKVYYK
uniref:Uncharacterized protein n=1 Tax=Cuerna arida TaxID=1464854 RepID=A0A1B6GFG7_9HEMI